MKKLLIMVLSMLFVAGGFTAVYADDAGMDSVRAAVPGSKVVIGGEGGVSGYLKNNYDMNSDADDDSHYFSQWAKIKVDANVGGTELRTRMVISDGKWNGGNNTGGSVTACANAGCTSTVNAGQTYLDYAYLHIPIEDVTIDIGRQKASFGNALYIKGQTRDRLQVTSKMQDAVVGVFADKLVEGVAVGDDKDEYGVFATQKVGDIEAGGMFVYHNDDTGANVTGQVIDVFANGKVGDIGVAVEFATKMGDAFKDSADNSQMGAMMKVSKAIDDAITVSGLVAYAANGYTADPHFTPTVFIGTDQGTAGMDFGAIADKNALAAVISTDYKASSDLSVTCVGAYVSLGGTKFDGSGDDASFIEIDGKLSYALAKNTTYSANVGYLMPNGMSATDDAAIALVHTVSIVF